MKIKKVISACLVLTCLVTGLSGCGKTDQVSDTAERSVIKLGSDSYPPYNYLNEDGVPTGIDVELATEAFGRMGYDVEIVNIDWEKKQELVENGDIYTLSDLEEKTLAVQSTTKPEGIFLKRTDSRIPKLGNLISLEHRELIYTFLGKGYADAIGAHEESVIQYMKDYDAKFRILDEPLMTVGIGVAFSKNETRDLPEKLEQTLDEMREDGTSAKIIGKYLDDPEKYLEVDQLEEE